VKHRVRYYSIEAGQIPAALLPGPWPLEITAGSPVALRRIIEEFAQYFQRELGYDYVQFRATDRSDYRAWLFASPPVQSPRVWAGACSFRFQDNPHIGRRWVLQWVWLHPYVRRRGLLGQAWSVFHETLGDFYVPPPFSDSMVAFLKRQGRCLTCWNLLDQGPFLYCGACIDQYGLSEAYAGGG
jgi:hypothetical protein